MKSAGKARRVSLYPLDHPRNLIYSIALFQPNMRVEIVLRM
jgi:hypothetical protein